MRKINCFFLVLCALISTFLFTSCASSVNNGGSNGGGTTPPVLDPGIYVSTTGNDSNSGLSASLPMLTIQLAVSNAAANGLTNIYVAQGVYKPGAGLNSNDNGLLINVDNIHLYGGYSQDFSTRTNKSELDATNALNQVIAVNNAQNLRIDGFILENGHSANGYAGGISLIQARNSVITNTIISNNYGNLFGGGLHILNSIGNIISAEIVSNSGNSGGGIFIDNLCLSNTFITTIVRNIARGGSGGGIYMTGSQYNSIYGSVASNTAPGDGGGIYLYSCQSNSVNANILWNTSTNDGGGACANNTCVYLTIEGQIASNTSRIGSGGGIMYQGSYLLVTNADIGYNYAYNGGGIYVYGVTNFGLSGNLIYNYAQGSGGGVYYNNCNSNMVSANFISNLSKEAGGGAYFYMSANSMINGTFDGNATTNSSGGAVMFWCVLNTEMTANFYNNSAVSNGSGGAMLIDHATNFSLTSCVFTNNWSYNGYWPGNAVIYLFDYLTNIMISNCTIGGSFHRDVSYRSYAFREDLDLSGHIFINNTFITNDLDYLYNDDNTIMVPVGPTWTNINATNYTDAAIASGNKVTNL